METFSERLRSEIDYAGYNQKEFAARAGIKKRALDMYLGKQESMPPADTAVRIARALGLTVEYLVTGEGEPLPDRDRRRAPLAAPPRPGPGAPAAPVSRDPLDPLDVREDLQALPREVASALSALIHTLARREAARRRTWPADPAR